MQDISWCQNYPIFQIAVAAEKKFEKKKENYKNWIPRKLKYLLKWNEKCFSYFLRAFFWRNIKKRVDMAYKVARRVRVNNILIT